MGLISELGHFLGVGGQILHVEEELKRRSSVQGTAIRPSAPLQVDASVDTGSMTRQLAPRVGTEVNASGDTEGGEADDLLNQNVLARQMLRNSSMSPSSESPLRRPAHIQPNMVIRVAMTYVDLIIALYEFMINVLVMLTFCG